MPFFLITFLISMGVLCLTWTPLATTKIGITNTFHCILKTAAGKLATQGLSIIAFAFFLHAILKSKVFQSLFASKRKWLEKRKYFTIGLITVAAALLSSNLAWFDEFVHFYPLVIPLLMAMGFDMFSSLFCLYGGSIAGLMGLVSSERMKDFFSGSFSSAKESINYSGMSGIGFRVAAFVLFTTMIVLFNIWYCNRNRKKKAEKLKDLTKAEAPPLFNRTRKVILAVAGFFLLVSIAAQIPKIAEKTSGKSIEKIPPEISNTYPETEYTELGRAGSDMKIVKSEEKKQSYWGTFGKWEDRAIDCWFIVGAIIICLLAKQSIMSTLTTAAQAAIPLILIYIFAAVPATILKDSGVAKNLARKLLPDKFLSSAAKYLVLSSIFAISILFAFLVPSPSIAMVIISALAPTLASISSSILIYAAVFAWTGVVLGMAFSPNNGILIASLEKNKVTYKQFIKKTWWLGLIMLLSAFSLVGFWTIYNIK